MPPHSVATVGGSSSTTVNLQLTKMCVKRMLTRRARGEGLHAAEENLIADDRPGVRPARRHAAPRERSRPMWPPGSSGAHHWRWTGCAARTHAASARRSAPAPPDRRARAAERIPEIGARHGAFPTRILAPTKTTSEEPGLLQAQLELCPSR